MHIQKVRQIAKRWGVDTKMGHTKQDLIREIQVREGYDPCYRTKKQCENNCLWKEDCAGSK